MIYNYGEDGAFWKMFCLFLCVRFFEGIGKGCKFFLRELVRGNFKEILQMVLWVFLFFLFGPGLGYLSLLGALGLCRLSFVETRWCKKP